MAQISASDLCFAMVCVRWRVTESLHCRSAHNQKNDTAEEVLQETQNHSQDVYLHKPLQTVRNSSPNSACHHGNLPPPIWNDPHYEIHKKDLEYKMIKARGATQALCTMPEVMKNHMRSACPANGTKEQATNKICTWLYWCKIDTRFRSQEKQLADIR